MANSDLVNGPAALASRQLSLFVNGSYHDFVLKCGNRSFKVHRCIICPQSHVLTTLCNGNWKEGKAGEATLEQPDPEVLEETLRFLYTGNYDNQIPRAAAGDVPVPKREFVERDALTFNVKMYMLADFLNIEALQKLAQSNCAYILDEPKSIASLTTPLLLALDNTNPNDCELRLEVLRFGAEWSHRTDVDANLLKACQDANPLAWAVALQAKDREDGLQDEVNILTNDLSNLRASNLRYEDAINLANRHTSCQNCFDLSRGGLSVSEDGAVLECRNYGHIHTMVSA